jgi:hypothetical protein
MDNPTQVVIAAQMPASTPIATKFTIGNSFSTPVTKPTPTPTPPSNDATNVTMKLRFTFTLNDAHIPTRVIHKHTEQYRYTFPSVLATAPPDPGMELAATPLQLLLELQLQLG